MIGILPRKTLLLSLLVLVYTFTGQAYGELKPIEHFVRHSDYLDLKLSPDGKHIAGRIRQNDKVNLYVMRTSDGKVVTGVEAPSKDTIHTVTWVNNERLVYEFAEKTHFLDQPSPTGELYAISVDGSDSKLLYGFRAGDGRFGSRIKSRESTKASQEVISSLSNDKKHILILEHPWEKRGQYLWDSRQREPTVSKLNVYTGRKKKVEHIPFRGASVLATQNGDIRFASWITNDGKFHAATRASKSDDWAEIPATGEFQNSPQPVFINTDGSRAYFLISRGEQGFQSLYQMDVATGEYTDLFPEIDADIENWQVDKSSGEPFVAMTYNSGTNYHYIDGDGVFGKTHKMLHRAFKYKDVTFTSTAADGVLALVHVASTTNPGEYYRFNFETKAADFMWANLSWIDNSEMRPMKSHHITARDGTELEVYLTLPKVADDAPPAGMVVIPHGGPHGVRDYQEFDARVQLLASRGLAVLQANYRGSAGYGRAFEEAGYREWGGKMIEDIVDATQWAAQQGHASKDRICLFGASYGGYAAMMAAATEPDLYRCAVGYVGVYDLNMVYSLSDVPDNWGGEAYLEKVLGTDKEVLTAASPVSRAEDIKADVMLIHGDLDRRAPIENAKAMRKALKKTGKKVVWETYSMSGHGVWDFKNRLDLHEKLLEFLLPRIGSAH